jgi:thiol:disulfide interchange protein DsbD
MSKKLGRILLGAFICILVGYSESQAASAVKVDHVELSIALESAAQPGSTVWVAIRQSIEPGWHTYWLNPGDSGLATSVSWTAPNGVTVGASQWPAPKRFATESIVNYGYDGTTTLLIPLAISRSAKIDSAPALANVSLLECAQMCIPEETSLDLDLRHASGSPELFAQARTELPRTFDGSAQVTVGPKFVVLTLTSRVLKGIASDMVQFIPATGRVVDNDFPPFAKVNENTLTWTAPLAAHARSFTKFEGVLTVSDAGVFSISANAVVPPPARATNTDDLTVLGAVGLAFLGGIILNLMPCVLPILSMKALALAQSGESVRELRRDGVFYLAGVLATFTALAVTLLILKAGGAALGWGYQLQSPLVVFALALLMSAIGLNLLGVFEIPLRLAGVGEGLTRAKGGHGAFFTGALAVVVASPCTAPFMGAALGYALTHSSAPAVFVFLALGTGFALPFTMLAFLPALFRFIPKPGPWMLRFKECLAFPMFATSIWLTWVLAQQVGVNGLAIALCISLGIAFLAWILPILGPRARWAVGVPGLALLLAGSLRIDAFGSIAESGWSPWSAEAVAEARNAGQPVLVDFSAAWCVTCLVNERIALDDQTVAARLKEYRVVTLKGDWTNHSAAIAMELGSFGRSGVPLYLLYPPGPSSDPIVLPQILTPATVLNALDRSVAHPHQAL